MYEDYYPSNVPKWPFYCIVLGVSGVMGGMGYLIYYGDTILQQAETY